jgi:copper transport protein
MKPSRWLAIALGSTSVLWVAAVWFSGVASAQGPHQHNGSSPLNAVISPQEVAVGIAHGTTLGAAVFLVGLVSFVALVWLPANQIENADQGKTVSLLCRWMWALVGILTVAGLVELPLYAVRASGETLSFGLLEEALFDTRVGQLWMLRLALAVLTATAVTYAAQQPRRLAFWWGTAFAISASLLMTLTQQSHAAAEEGFLPLAADWLHLMAASLWMGGLLGFPILLVGPLRAIPIEPRLKLLSRLVPRFSKVATTAVMGLIVTGLVAVLLHVPNVSALIDTPYGRALGIKLGLLIFLLALGAQNLRLRGRGPFNRVVSTELILAIGIFVATGFLTSFPPADAEQPPVEESIPNPAEDIRQPPMPDVQSATAQPKG